jgi:hypothetical protein
VQRIITDTSFAPVWTALSDFIKTRNRTLIVIIGNHDLELALPPVQRLIVSRLAGEDIAGRSRIEFATMGAGYSCLVGNARVFCTHGNEVDAWNMVRYEDLSRLARRLNAARALDASEWQPNAGTRLVKDVMNEVKRRYAWIDLLKPETQAAIGVLLVLDPTQMIKIMRLVPVGAELVHGASTYRGRLGEDDWVAGPTLLAPTVALGPLLGPSLAQALNLSAIGARPASDPLADAMLLEAELNYRTPRFGGLGGDQTLGVPQLLWDRLTGWIRGVGRDEALRRALVDWLRDDRSFDVEDKDFTYTAVTKSVGTGIDFIVTGHTHLERAIDMGGNRFYFNGGTWIRLLRLTAAMLEDINSFKPAYELLTDGRLSAIDAATLDGEPFVMDRTSAVCIKIESAGVVGTLGHILGGASIEWREVQRFVRS